jgi:hypothetical protein
VASVIFDSTSPDSPHSTVVGAEDRDFMRHCNEVPRGRCVVDREEKDCGIG